MMGGCYTINIVATSFCASSPNYCLQVGGIGRFILLTCKSLWRTILLYYGQFCNLYRFAVEQTATAVSKLGYK